MINRFHQTFGFIATAIVLLAFIWGIAIVGSPFTGRQQRFDDKRLQDLQTINSEIMNIVYEGRPRTPEQKPVAPLPSTLDEVLQKALYQRPSITDPESGQTYEYTVRSPTVYLLCATFSFARSQQYDIFWNHPEGNSCFIFDTTQVEGHGPTQYEPIEPVDRSVKSTPAPVK